MLRMTLTGRVEELLPGTEVAQGHASIAGQLWSQLLVLYYQHLDHHKAHGILQAGMGIELRSHPHQSEEVVLQKEISK